MVFAKRYFKEKLNCSVVIPANRSSTLMVNLPTDLNQWRLKDRLPDERKYVIYNHNLNALIKAPFGVVTAFPNYPNPLFSSHCHSQESIPSCNTSSSGTNSKLGTDNTVSIAIQTDPEPSDFQPDAQLTASLWETEFAIAEFEQQNRNLMIELSNLKVSPNCANRLRGNAKINADRAESKLEISEELLLTYSKRIKK